MAHDAPDNSGQFRHCRQRLPLHDAAGQPPALGAADIGDVDILADNRLPWELRTSGTWTSRRRSCTTACHSRARIDGTRPPGKRHAARRTAPQIAGEHAQRQSWDEKQKPSPGRPRPGRRRLHREPECWRRNVHPGRRHRLQPAKARAIPDPLFE
ncbi:MAG TPA: hypothetical protein PLH67_02795 [Lentisphaeria bacterium]|nr:hypothetical protein [Lentisphaeria bacterium]